MSFIQVNIWPFVIIVGGAAALMSIIALVYRYVKSRVGTPLWGVLVEAIYLPFHLFVICGATFLLLQRIPVTQGLEIMTLSLQTLRSFLFLCIFVWSVFRVIHRTEAAAVNKHRQSKCHKLTTIRVMAKVGRIATIGFAVMSALQCFGLSISALLTFGGIGSVMVGFAAKDSLSNFLGGMMIFMDRPFMVGDWITSPDRDIEGTVENIGWRLTTIRTFDQRLLYVPNGAFSNIAIENASRMSHRRIKTTVGLRHCDADKIEKILASIKNMMRNHPDVDTEKRLLVNFVEFGESSLDIQVYGFTKITDWALFQDIQQDVFLKILSIIKENGANCAVPARNMMFSKKDLFELKENNKESYSLSASDPIGKI